MQLKTVQIAEPVQKSYEYLKETIKIHTFTVVGNLQQIYEVQYYKFYKLLITMEK